MQRQWKGGERVRPGGAGMVCAWDLDHAERGSIHGLVCDPSDAVSGCQCFSVPMHTAAAGAADCVPTPPLRARLAVFCALRPSFSIARRITEADPDGASRVVAAY